MKALKIALCISINFSMFMVGHISAAGMGEKLLRSENTELTNSNSDQKDVLFSETDSDKLNGVKDQFLSILENMRIEVVAPGSHLMTMMNKITSKTQIMFTSDYDRYFRNMAIDSTDKPMLRSYLGLHLATGEQIESWYRPNRKRSRSHILRSCKSLINSRNKSIKLDAEKSEKLRDLKHLAENKFYLAYLTFKSNLNLFMLDTYLILCLKLEPEQLKDDLKDVLLVF